MCHRAFIPMIVCFMFHCMSCMAATAEMGAIKNIAEKAADKEANETGGFATENLPVIVLKNSNREIKKFKQLPCEEPHVSMNAFRAIADYPRPVLLEIDSDEPIRVYNNGKHFEGVPAAKSPDHSLRSYIPLMLEKG